MPTIRLAHSLRLYGGVLLLSLLGLLACSKQPAGNGDEENSDSSSAAVAEVTLTKVARADISSTLSVSGTIAGLPNQDVKVSSLVPGRIAEMLVAEGDPVKEGAVLARIDDGSFRDQLQQAQASVDQAKATFENARANRVRSGNLFERGIAARKDMEDATTQERVAEAALKQSESAVALARLQLSRTEVKSPLSGTVVKRLVSTGEQVDGTGAQPIFEVANTAEVELYGNVPAVYLQRIRAGQALRVLTEAFPGKDFAGRVAATSPAVDPSTNVGLVRIRIGNQAGLLRLGMFLTAQVPLETHAHALVAPPQAIYRDSDGQPRIFRVQGDKAEAVPVNLGIETKDRVELLSGAQEGDAIILTGAYGLGANAKIKVKP